MNQPHIPPPASPAAPPGLTEGDENTLNLLSTLFFVYAAFVGLIAIVCGAFAFMKASTPQVQHGEQLVGGVFMAVFGAFALFLLAKAVLIVVAGRALTRRTNYVLCIIGACVSLMNIPLGTALGIFAITVLQRPAVKARFSYPA